MSERVEVRRNRQWRIVAALGGVVLVFFGFMFLGPGGFAVGDTQIIAPPEEDANGALTLLGQRERRADIVWGTVFLAAGAGFVLAGVMVIRRRPTVAAVDDAGLELFIRGPRRDPLVLPWEAILSVHTAWDEDETGQMRALVVELVAGTELPDELWGARRNGNQLIVDARRWVPAPVVIADYATFALAGGRRSEA
jgi:hypothetical protein